MMGSETVYAKNDVKYARKFFWVSQKRCETHAKQILFCISFASMQNYFFVKPAHPNLYVRFWWEQNSKLPSPNAHSDKKVVLVHPCLFPCLWSFAERRSIVFDICYSGPERFYYEAGKLLKFLMKVKNGIHLTVFKVSEYILHFLNCCFGPKNSRVPWFLRL